MADYECTIDVTTALDWQRSNADVVKQLVLNQQAWLEEYHCKFWDDWVDNVFTLKTADDFGLSVWAIILDESIYGYSGASPVDYPAFGFASDSENFDNGSFATDSAYTYEFTTEQKRIILQLKAFKVFAMNGSVQHINKSLVNIFGDGVLICYDTREMEFTYTLNDSKYEELMEYIIERDLLPRPIGIKADQVTFNY